MIDFLKVIEHILGIKIDAYDVQLINTFITGFLF